MGGDGVETQMASGGSTLRVPVDDLEAPSGSPSRLARRRRPGRGAGGGRR